MTKFKVTIILIAVAILFIVAIPITVVRIVRQLPRLTQKTVRA